jgi:hypothetical protein
MLDIAVDAVSEMALNVTSVSQNVSETTSDAFAYFSLFTLLFFVIPSFVIYVLLLVAVVTEKDVKSSIKLILANILITALVVIVGLAMTLLSSVILSADSQLSPSGTLCRLIYIVLLSGAMARLLFMTTYAVTVSVLIRYGPASVGFLPVFIASLSLWIFSTAPNISLISPNLFEIAFIDGNDCAPIGGGHLALAYTIVNIIVYGVCSFSIAIISLVITICYIKRNAVEGDPEIHKGITRFALFLIIGDTASLLGIVIPIAIGTFAPSGNQYSTLISAFNYIDGIVLMVSLIPVPVILLVFFKGVREQMKLIMCVVCLKTHRRRRKL